MGIRVLIPRARTVGVVVLRDRGKITQLGELLREVLDLVAVRFSQAEVPVNQKDHRVLLAIRGSPDTP